MATKVQAQKFDKIDAGRIIGKVKHSRTGACTCRYTEKCNHGSNRAKRKK